VSDRPASYGYAHNPLRVLVETGPRTGEFVLDPRLAVDSLLLGSNETDSRATVRLFSGPLDATSTPEDRLEPGDVLFAGARPGFQTFISPEQRFLIVRYPESGSADPELLFAGYCMLPRYDERGGSGGMAPNSERGFVLTITSTWDRVATLTRGLIVGRNMRTAAAQDALDAAQDRSSALPIAGQTVSDSTRIVDSLPCEFNAGGLPNRAAAPVQVDGEERYVHVFAGDADPDAKYWTYAQVLRYLTVFHLQSAYTMAPDEGLLVIDGDGLDLTEDMLEWPSESHPRPAAPPDLDDVWEYAMLAMPQNLSVETLNICEAMTLFAASAKVRFAVIYSWDPEDPTVPRSQLIWSGRGTGPAKTIAKGSFIGLPTSPPLIAEEVVELCQIKDFSAQIDYRDVNTWPKVIGDIKRYEITSQLVPGWVPDDNLDDVADVETAIEYALAHHDCGDPEEVALDPWFRQYHKSGAMHERYRVEGRRWVLNETGRYRAAEYARQTGHFVADRYTPWGPETVALNDTAIDQAGEVVGIPVLNAHWSRRPRPFQPCFSADAMRQSMGIYVEFSFDSGYTWWHLAESRIANLQDEAGIYLDDEDLTLLKRPNETDEGISFWEAMVRGYARIRVTAVIDGDHRLDGDAQWTDLGAVMQAATGRVIDLSGRFHSNRQDGANSIFAPPLDENNPDGRGDREAPGTTPDEIDDLAAITDAARTFGEWLAGRQTVCSLVVPWLTRDYEVLDTLTEIEGANLELRQFASDRDDAEAGARPVDIVAIEYVGAFTRIMLDDDRMIDQVEF